jgi:hypothetical protein
VVEVVAVQAQLLALMVVQAVELLGKVAHLELVALEHLGKVMMVEHLLTILHLIQQVVVGALVLLV